MSIDYVDATIGRCLARGSISLAEFVEWTGFSRAKILNHLPRLGDAVSREFVREDTSAIRNRGNAGKPCPT